MYIYIHTYTVFVGRWLKVSKHGSLISWPFLGYRSQTSNSIQGGISIPSLDGTTITGGWLSHPSEKYEFVSWDDDIPKYSQYMEK